MSKPFIPPTIYHDTRNLYLEWPDHVQRFPFTEGGLSKALKLIPHIASTPGYLSGGANIADKLLDTRKAKIATKTAVKRDAVKATEGQRRSASEAIRRLKLRASE